MKTKQTKFAGIVGDVECAPAGQGTDVAVDDGLIYRPDGTTVTRMVADSYRPFTDYYLPRSVPAPQMDNDFIYRSDGTTIARKVIVVATAARKPAAATTGGKRLPKGMAEAMQGIMPDAPDFSANTHKPHRNRLAQVVALVAARDLEGLRAWSVKPTSSSPIAIMRYRDCAIKALEVQAAQR